MELILEIAEETLIYSIPQMCQTHDDLANRVKTNHSTRHI